MTAREAAAETLARARLDARSLADLLQDQAPKSLDDSYALQTALNAKLAAAGLGRTVGFKIGCTTRVMQEYLKIPHPCVGEMFETTVFRDHGVFPRDRLCRPGVECEIAVRLGADMDSGAAYDAASGAASVAAVMTSIELVDDRWHDFAKVDTPTLVAENFFNAGCVLGPEQAPGAVDLAAVRGRMRINGAEVGSGAGDAILGHPFSALAWLAEHRKAQGAPLRAGDLVTLGSVVQTQWIEAGDRVEIDFDGLGGCSLEIA